MKRIYPILLCGGIVSLYGATGTIKSDVKIREFPSMKGKKVGAIKKGRTIEVIQKENIDKNGYWYKTPRGYIYHSFVKVGKVPVVVKFTKNQQKELKSTGTDIIHPYGNPMYIDASKMENKPTLFADEKGQVYTKSSFPVVAPEPTTIVTPIEKEVVVQKENTQGALVEEKVVQKEVITPIPVVAVVPVVQEEQKEELKEVVKTEELLEKKEVKAQEVKVEDLKIQEVKIEELKTQQEPDTTKRYFAGIGFGLNSLDVKKQDQAGSILLNKTPDEKATSFTFLGGMNLSQNRRIYGNYEILNLDDVEIKSYYLSYDYIFPYFLSPYLGVSLGMADLKWQIDPLVNSQIKDDKLSSLLYGIQGGIEYPIENQLNIYSQISYQKLDFTTNLISTPSKSTITHESKKSFVMGLKYSF